MHKLTRILVFGFIALMIVLAAGTGCAVKKNPWQKKKTKGSHVSTSQLGRNKYYFSVGYQKKLQKSVKKK
jgi:hypothetical protein